jgi:hypothetical protein
MKKIAGFFFKAKGIERTDYGRQGTQGRGVRKL